MHQSLYLTQYPYAHADLRMLIIDLHQLAGLQELVFQSQLSVDGYNCISLRQLESYKKIKTKEKKTKREEPEAGVRICLLICEMRISF